MVRRGGRRFVGAAVVGVVVLAVAPADAALAGRAAAARSCNLGVRRSGGWVELVDLATGQPRRLPPPPTARGPAVDAFAAPESCDVYVVTSGPWFVPTVFGYHSDGKMFSARATALPADQMVATPSGMVAVRSTGDDAPVVVDVGTNETRFDLPPLEPLAGGTRRTWTPIGATSDGSVFAFEITAPTGIGYQIGLFTGTGSSLGMVPVPSGNRPVSLSPDGNYLALVDHTGPSSLDVVVTTLSGSFVTRSPTGWEWASTPSPSFMGVDTIVLCGHSGNGVASARWDGFSDPVPIAASRASGCLLAAE